MLTDRDILQEIELGGLRITPFCGYEEQRLHPQRGLTHGLGSTGYDLTLAPRLLRFKEPYDAAGVTLADLPPIDPLDESSLHMEEVAHDGRSHVLAHGEFVLGCSVETIVLPRHLAADCLGKSTWERCGLAVRVTPLESEWAGRLTIEIQNTNRRRHLRLPFWRGICQIRFFHCFNVLRSYADKGGRYQHQTDVTPARA